jgi:hypothetical protein
MFRYVYIACLVSFRSLGDVYGHTCSWITCASTLIHTEYRHVQVLPKGFRVRFRSSFPVFIFNYTWLLESPSLGVAFLIAVSNVDAATGIEACHSSP